MSHQANDANPLPLSLLTIGSVMIGCIYSDVNWFASSYEAGVILLLSKSRQYSAILFNIHGITETPKSGIWSTTLKFTKLISELKLFIPKLTNHVCS